MRIIYSSNDQKQASHFSNFLKSKGIDNQLELISNTDWGHADYGTTTGHVWVIDEDRLDESLKMRDEFQNNPNSPEFKVSESKLKSLLDPLDQTLGKIQHPRAAFESGREEIPRMGYVTLYIMLTCIMLFLLASMTSTEVTKYPANLPYAPFTTAPVNKMLMYDYPKAFEVVDEAIKTYGVEKILHPQNLPQEGIALLEKFHNTPYWEGIYDNIVLYFQNDKSPWNFTAPLFEKIKAGQVWRAVTPMLMHGSFFHIVFNLILFVILGRQMENKIGSLKYLIFILIAAIFSNTAQYLMTGTGFLGISGVVCAMVGFIFVRQRRAAWEGYQFSSVSLSSVYFFIMLMFGLQVISFLVEIYFKTNLSPGIANTAHLSGLGLGMILGFTNLFKVQNE
jgi:GlpG protein